MLYIQDLLCQLSKRQRKVADELNYLNDLARRVELGDPQAIRKAAWILGLTASPLGGAPRRSGHNYRYLPCLPGSTQSGV